MSRLTEVYPTYVVFVLHFLGSLALQDSRSSLLVETLRHHQDQYRHWVWPFIQRMGSDSGFAPRTEQQQALKIDQVLEQTHDFFKEILGVEDGQANYTTVRRADAP